MPSRPNPARSRTAGASTLILLAESNQTESYRVATALQAAGIGVDRVTSTETAVAMAMATAYAVVVVSSSFDGGHGATLCRHLRGQGLRSIVVFIADPTIDDEAAVAATGADEWVSHPVDPHDLIAIIDETPA